MPKLQDIYQVINQLAPWNLAEGWDHSGLQVGSMDRLVKRILLAVDFNQAIFEEGLSQQVDGFILHHPLLFKPLSQIDLGSPLGKHISHLIKNDLFVLAAHTNADNAADGLNRYMADLLGLEQIRTIQKKEDQYFKLVVFVPEDHLTSVRNAIAAAGAGEIGDYRYCSFSISGTGSFLPGETTHPFIGTVGKLETLREIRLEMVVAIYRLHAVIDALLKTHPYEEPAYDIYPLINPSEAGLGRMGTLPEPITLGELGDRIKQKLNCSMLRIGGDLKRTVRRIAVCTGSGKSLIPKIRHQVDVYITADLGYHDFCDALEFQLALIDVGHRTSEKCFIDWMADFLNLHYPPDQLTVIKSKTVPEEPYQFI